MAALKVGRLDLGRRRAVIAESVTTMHGSGQVWGTPKTHGRRKVPVPAFLVQDLAEHVAGKGEDELVFPGVRGGGALRATVFRRAPSTTPRPPSGCRGCTRTSCGTPRHPWRSRPAPTSRSSSRCSVTPRRR
jgi:hypothetical protein